MPKMPLARKSRSTCFRRLPARCAEQFEGRGIYYGAATTEALSCRGEVVYIIGAGNSAGQAAVFLADKGSSVTVVIRRSELSSSMSGYLVRRLEGHPHIEVLTQSEVVALEGDEVLQAIQIAGPGGETSRPCSALFSFVGADPQSAWLSSCAALDEHGFILTDRSLAPDLLDGVWDLLGRSPLPYETSHPGLFAVGDVRSGSAKRVATAVGALTSARRCLEDTIEYTRQRKAFGQPIASFQNTQFKLAEMMTEVEVGQAFIDRLLAAHVRGDELDDEPFCAPWIQAQNDLQYVRAFRRGHPYTRFSKVPSMIPAPECAVWRAFSQEVFRSRNKRLLIVRYAARFSKETAASPWRAWPGREFDLGRRRR